MVKTKICKYVAVTPRFTVEGTTGKWVVGSSVKPCAVYMANVFLPQVSQERRQQIKKETEWSDLLSSRVYSNA